jgi:CheY-like chemotaxis protein
MHPSREGHTARRLEAIGRLAGGVAHDLNNLVTVLRLELDLLRREVTDRPRAMTRVEELSKAIEVAASLNARLLAFARSEAVRAEPLDPLVAIRDFRPALAGIAGERIRLTIELAPDTGWIELDASGLEQVLLNLVANARDAIVGPGEIDVALGRAALDAACAGRLRDGVPGDYVTISVRDSGCGMDEETSAQIFEPFFTTKAERGGSGIGLSTVHALVIQAGGFLDVQSQVGRGTVIVAYLPRVEPVRPSARVRALEPLSGRGETVLLVDDDATVREMLRAMLERNGYQVIAARGPVEALDELARDPAKIRLLLSDVVMPGMDGLDLLDEARSLRPGLPAVLMSAFTLDEMLGPGVRFVQKPFRSEDALRELRDALDAA